MGLIQVILNGIFTVVTTIADGLMRPIFGVVVGLFPALSVHFTHFLDFLQSAFTYLTCIYRWFLFTPNMFLLLFDFFIVKYTIFLFASTLRFAIKVYRDLKI